MRIAEVDRYSRGHCELLVRGHLATLVPGQRAAQVLGQGLDQRHQHVADLLGGVPAGQMPEHDVAGGTLDQGHDRALASRADDQIAFPVAGNRPVLHLGRTLGDHHHLVDESAGALFRAAARLAAGAPAAQRDRDLAAQAASGLDVDGLVDRLRTHPHALVVGELDDHSVTDLFRGPAFTQLVLNVSTQRTVCGELRGLGP